MEGLLVKHVHESATMRMEEEHAAVKQEKSTIS